MKLVVIGTGYVGLVSGTCFAELGHDVVCIDHDSAKINALKGGQIPIFEPGLERLVTTLTEQGKLCFDTDLSKHVPSSDMVFIAVGTPPQDDGSADLQYVFQAAKDISAYLPENGIVVTKSTVPVGTGREVTSIIEKERPGLHFSVASNPEFLREGCAVKDFLEPDRVVVGVNNSHAAASFELLYQPLMDQKIPLLITDIQTAELTKYAANAYLACKIAFINEMADVSENVGANIEDIARGMGLDHRIGMEYLKPGPGFGGSCFPKDTLALNYISKQANAPSQLVNATIQSNQQRFTRLSDRIYNAVKNMKEPKIGVLGLAFKANTDDARHSPAISIIENLVESGCRIIAHDPKAQTMAKQILSKHSQHIAYAAQPEECFKNCDALLIATEWNAYRTLDYNTLAKDMRQAFLFDYRNILLPQSASLRHWNYHCIGF